MIGLPTDQLSCASAAGPSFAGHGQIVSPIFGGVKVGGVLWLRKDPPVLVVDPEVGLVWSREWTALCALGLAVRLI